MSSVQSVSDSSSNALLNIDDYRPFSLVWLDENINGSLLYVDVRKRLRKIIDFIETFDGIDLCEDYVKNTIGKSHMIIVVGESIGHDITIRIHDLSQVLSICILEDNYSSKQNTKWIEKFSKVKGIFDQVEPIILQITMERKRWHKIGDPLVFDVFHIGQQSEKSSSNISGNFLHSQLLIDLLLRFKSTSENRKEFIDFCKKQYATEKTVLRTIDDFERNYDDEYAVWWYTRDTFLFRRLNKALRVENIDWLFLFRFFIRAMHNILNELQQEQKNSTTIERVYRSQLISSHEIIQLKNSLGGLVSFNSFLSTSRNRNHTIFILGDCLTDSDDMYPILFEIEVNYQLINTNKPFADITGMSAFADGEQGTLFMIGSVFRLEETFMENNITVFKMSVCSETDHDLKALFEHMKNEIGIGTDDTLLTLGTLLQKFGRFEEASQFYRRMLKELMPNDSLVLNCFQGLGLVETARGDYDAGLKWHIMILEHFQKTLPANDYQIGCIWNTIGNVHWRAKSYELVLHAYNEALNIFGPHHDRDTSACLNNMGNVYEETGQYEKALEYHLKSISIREGILPPNHSDIGVSHHNIANVYRRLGQFNNARIHIKQALRIFQKSLRTNDPSIAATYQTMGALEFDIGAYREGLKYLEQSAAIYRETLPANHPTIEAIHLTIAEAIRAMFDLGLQFI